MFDDLIGQDKAVELLQQAVRQKRIAPAYLFSGDWGIGKSKAARSFSKLLLTMDSSPNKLPGIERKLVSGNHPDLLWVEPTYLSKGELYTATQAAEKGLQYKTPPKLRIEQIRSITQFLQRPVLEANRKVVVIEEAQTMSEATANALLKTLEEPGNATLILLAPDSDALLVTIVSRCQQIRFRNLSSANLTTILRSQGYEEILEHPELMALAQGSPGQAISAWQQLQTIPPELLQQLKGTIASPLQAIELAKIISKELDGQTQLWLVDYLQHHYWQKFPQLELMTEWEKTRSCLLSYVQPRLVWECMLLLITDYLDPA